MRGEKMKLELNQLNAPMYNGVERRKYQRIEKPLIIKFRVNPENYRRANYFEWDMVSVNDLSDGGLFFNSSYNIHDGTLLDFMFGFPKSSTPVKCTGIVTRVKKQPHTSIFGIAAAFMEIEEKEKKLENTFINKTYSDRY